MKSRIVKAVRALLNIQPGVRMAIVDFGTNTPNLPAIAKAITRQCQEQFALPPPHGYGISASVRVAAGQADVKDDEWVIGLFSNPDQPGALGYHDQTATGQPLMKIFPTLDPAGVSVTISHEVLECLADPNCSRACQQRDGTFWSYEVCLTGDTTIPLLNGTEIKIEDLIGKEEFWLYSCDKNGHIVPGRGHSARLTKENSEIVCITLDNGEKIKCTPDHPFMLRNGEYKKAGDLQPNESLMPLYRKNEQINERVYDPGFDKWVFTHRAVLPQCYVGYVRHHVDFNRFNNEPSNLKMLLKEEHLRVHGDRNREMSRIKMADGTHPFLRKRSEEHKQKLRDHIITFARSEKRLARHKEWLDKAITNGTHPFQQPHSEEKKEADRERIIEYNKSDAHKEVAAKVGSAILKRLWAEDEDYRERKTEEGRLRMSEFNQSEKFQQKRKAAWEKSRTEEFVEKERRRLKEMNASPEFQAKRKAGYEKWRKAREGAVVNHKVVSVESIDTANVYDLSVDGYHNFAVSAGVFVHNCDGVERDTYYIDGIKVSNFALPPYFEPVGSYQGVKLDWLGLCTKPLEIRPGGYNQYFDPRKGWVMVQKPGHAMSAYRQSVGESGHGRGASRRNHMEVKVKSAKSRPKKTDH